MAINKISNYVNFNLINLFFIKSPSVSWSYVWKVICDCLTSCINRTSITYYNNRFIFGPIKLLYNKTHKAYNMWCNRRNTSYYTKYKHLQIQYRNYLKLETLKYENNWSSFKNKTLYRYIRNKLSTYNYKFA